MDFDTQELKVIYCALNTAIDYYSEDMPKYTKQFRDIQSKIAKEIDRRNNEKAEISQD